MQQEQVESLQQADQPHVYSVSSLNQAIKAHLEGEFPQVWLKGEISNFKIPPSGHFYFSLKDKNSQIRAVMFKGHNHHLKIRIENGMEVLVKANVSVYAPRGDYQLICEYLEPIGQGILQAQFEQLKKKLKSEGLFDKDKKKPIPSYPQRIALVTSPTGAVIRDLLNVLHRRFNGLDITLIPTLVQGENAPEEIVKAIDLAHHVKPAFDVMVVARGGGSLEDLWCFNSEEVARSIAFSSIPVVSAIGHEVDFTIADCTADLRAPTPSAAAELIVPDQIEVLQRIDQTTFRLKNIIHHQLDKQTQRCLQLHKRLKAKDPQRQLLEFFQKNDELLQRMHRAFQNHLLILAQNYQSVRRRLRQIDPHWQKENERLQMLSQALIKHKKVFLENKKLLLDAKVKLLNSLSPLKVVARGFSIVRRLDDKNCVVTSASQVKIGDKVEMTFAQGGATAQITAINKTRPKQ